MTLTFNNESVTVPDGSSVLEAVNASGTYIPQLCKDPYMKSHAVSNTKFEPLE